MPKEYERTRRVAEQIQRELAVLIQQELKDPRLGMLTISAVQVSKDMSIAKVFITVFNEEQDRKKTLEALQHAAGFLQHELGRSLSLRSIPKLRFVYDESIVRGAELSALIDKAVKEDRAKHHEEENES
ncbi:MAG: 30S ribosome-binding factor RbfA [Gammaproteobacteria bacterium]|nr:30S ribosome-binding factor RbfA [Gammaproteobacteria bacterium]